MQEVFAITDHKTLKWVAGLKDTAIVNACSQILKKLKV